MRWIERYRDYIIAFIVLGIPFLVELYIAFFYKEFLENLYVFSSLRKSLRIIQISVTFLSFYCVYILTKWKKTVIAIWVICICIPTTLDIISIRFSGMLISEGFVCTILDTNLKEAMNAVKDYFLYALWIPIAVYALPKPKVLHKKFWIYAISSVFISIAAIFELMGLKLLSFHVITKTTLSYIKDQMEIKKYNHTHSSLLDIHSEIDEKQKETFVIVIGESVDRKHMGIYGYERQTTPYFSALRDELFVFKNVNTAYVYTSTAINSIFRFNDLKDKKCHTLIQFFRSAGFKTFWFSNQGNLEFFENSVARIGKFADKYVFLNNTIIADRDFPLDAELLPHFENALQDPAEKKLIIFHFVGSHTPISNRYPPSFEKFKPYKFKDREKALVVAKYDNSILYTDYVLNQILQELRAHEKYSGMIYLSDHGMDVEDKEDCVLTARTYPNSYEVPFIIWVSEDYKKKNAAFMKIWDTNVPYITNQAAYTIIDFIRRNHPSLDISKSIFRKKK